MKPVVVIINGLAEAGKDTFVEYVANELKYKNPLVQINNLHRSDVGKRKLFDWGWDGVKTPEVRHLLKGMVDFQETSGYLLNWVKTHIQKSCTVTFVHVRDPFCIERYVEELKDFNVITLFIKNDNSSEIDEWNIEDYAYHEIIYNDKGLKELNDKAREFANKLEVNYEC